MAFPDDWGHFFEITVQASEVSGSHSDFPVYFPLADAPAGFWDKVQSDGSDVRVTDGQGGLIPHEVSYINTGAEEGSLWFKPASIDDQTDRTFRVFYDNPGVSALATTDQNGRNSVWSNGFVAVYHLEETNNEAVDSTGNGYDATTQGVADVAGKIGKGHDIRQTGDEIKVNASGGIFVNQNENITFSAWSYLRSFNNNAGFWRSGSDGAGNSFNIYNGRSGRPWIRWGGDNVLRPYSGVEQSLFQWSHVAYVTESGKWSGWYLDGSLGHEVIHSSATPSMSIHQFGWEFDKSVFVDGKIDEIRFSNVKRSSSWIATEYANQNDPATFFGVGVEQSLFVEVDLNSLEAGTPVVGALNTSVRSDLNLTPTTAGTLALPTIQAAATTLSLRRVSDTGRNTISVTSGGRSVTLTGRTSNRAEITNG